MHKKSGYFFVLVSALAISACAKKEGIETAPTLMDAPAPAPAVSIGTTKDALDLMGMGEENRAREILESILAHNPGDKIAKKYLDQIVVHPDKLLGVQSYKYRVKSGDTMASIARNMMGDSSLFYALSRYNEISDPRRINAGQIIKIPGSEPKAKKPDTRPATTKSKTSPQQAETDQSNATANPRLATQLRAEGLAALNRGSISRAVNLLSQANALDPSNPAIAADLARAKRIQKTVGN